MSLVLKRAWHRMEYIYNSQPLDDAEQHQKIDVRPTLVLPRVKKNFTNYWQCALAAVIFHAIIFSLFFLSLYIDSKTIPVSVNQISSMHAYLSKNISNQTIPSLKFTLSSQKNKIFSKENKSTSSSDASPMTKRVMGTPSSSFNELVSLLHQQIQARQIYPPQALEMNQTGRVVVAFLLTPNGMASDIHLVKSSGNANLDNAALSAVKAATPFQGVAHYLQTSEHFQIDIVFATES